MSEHICNLVIPGAGKSGTSSLHEYLNEHPDICMSSTKEPHFFSRDSYYVQGPAHLNALFDSHGAYRFFGESSTTYLVDKVAMSRIREDLNSPKIIMILRHPIERTFSHYRWRFRLGFERRCLIDALAEDGYGFDPEKPDRFGYMAYFQFSRYSQYCPLWIDLFGGDNCLILSSEELSSDPHAAMARCWHFLGLEPLGVLPAIVANRTDELRRRAGSPEMTRLASVLPGWMRQSHTFRAFKRELLSRRSANAPNEMTAEELEHIARELADDVAFYHSVCDASRPLGSSVD